MNDEEEYGPLCTYAATGTKPHFQAIFLCHTCTTNEHVKGDQAQLMSLCICNSCAEICHEGHIVEYYGEGISYCDCHNTFTNDNDGYKSPNSYTQNGHSCCKLYKKSKQIAMKLNIHNEDGGTDLGILVPNNTKIKGSQFPFLCDVFDVPLLRPCDTFIKQAQELVKHTRETHWVSCRQSNIDSDYEEMCDLEKLAYSIFQRHTIAYDLENIVNNNNNNDIGAEWWVQVKQTTDEAIDLHYDKDEELASAFDLGSFPTLSTVTYLTEGSFGTNEEGLSISAPPTLVFAHTHEMVDEGPLGQSAFDNVNEEEEEEKVMDKKRDNHTPPQLMISHAREGKHLCFDGRLLHGASSDILLRKQFHNEDEKSDSLARKDGLRVTFLVNIWLSRRPSQVESLQNEIRSKLKSYSIQQGDFLPSPMTTLEMIEKEPKRYFVEDGNDRITLPFVSSDATWIEEEVEQKDENGNEEDVSGLVVSLVPPTVKDRSVDTMVVLYDEGFEPSLVHLGDDEDEK